MTKTTDTFPRNCEMANGAMRLGYSNVQRAEDAAIVEQELRDGALTADEAATLAARIEGHRYSAGAFVR